MSDLLSQTSLTPAQQQYLDALRRAARTLSGVLENALDNNGRDIVAAAERFWLPDIIEAVVATVRDRAAAAGLQLEVAVGPDVPRRLVGDPLRLQQVLINLMVNAVKYTEAGRVTLRVSTVGSSEEDPVQLLFEVIDTGSGIDTSALERIFQPNVRLAEHAHLDGAGLGLGITQRLVDELRGTIEVVSRTRHQLGPDQATGSTFRVRLSVKRSTSGDTSAVGLQGLTVTVLGSRGLEAAVRQALAPWATLIERLSVEAFREAFSSPRPSDDTRVIVSDDAHLAIASAVRHIKLVAVLAAGSLGRFADHIERDGAVPIFLPVTAGSLVSALQRVMRDNDATNKIDLVDLRGAVIHAADDDDDARALIRAFLGATGARLHLYATVTDLVVGVGEDPTATMVLCDVEMPDGGAWVALAALPKNDAVALVAITARRDCDVNEFLTEGFAEVVRKPLNRQELTDLVRRVGMGSSNRPAGAGSKVIAKRDADADDPNAQRDALQLEARMALARRDYRALHLLARRVPAEMQARLEAAAHDRNDASLRDLLRDLDDAGKPTAPTTPDAALRSLLPDYLMRRRHDVVELRVAAGRGDAERVAFIAHRMAGTAAAFGLPQVGEVAARIEAASAGDATVLLLLITQLETGLVNASAPHQPMPRVQ